MLGDHAIVTLVDVVTLDADSVSWPSFDLLLVLTSTYGSGKPPESATRCVHAVTVEHCSQPFTLDVAPYESSECVSQTMTVTLTLTTRQACELATDTTKLKSWYMDFAKKPDSTKVLCCMSSIMMALLPLQLLRLPAKG